MHIAVAGPPGEKQQAIELQDLDQRLGRVLPQQSHTEFGRGFVLVLGGLLGELAEILLPQLATVGQAIKTLRNERQRAVAERHQAGRGHLDLDQLRQAVLKTEDSGLWPDVIVTEISPLKNFFKAEDYHQDYYFNNPAKAYCSLVIAPKVKKFQKEFSHLLK